MAESKSALLYRNTVVVSSETHAQWSIEAEGGSYEFARDVGFVPLTTPEFEKAAHDYPIVFVEDEDAIRPCVILGYEQDQNLFVDVNGVWVDSYVPAFVRRYPFIFGSDTGRESMTLVMDSSYAGFNQEGRGERLFLSGGGRTAYLERLLEFLQQYQAETKRSAELSAELKRLEVLEPVQAQVSLDSGQQLSLGGFSTVNRDRLRALPASELKTLAQTDWLELIYVHLFSLANFATLMNRLAKRDAVVKQSDE